MIVSTHGSESQRRGSAQASTVILAVIAISAAVAVVAGLIALGELLRNYDPTAEFVYRRLADKFSWAVILAPVGFAFVVLWIILFFRQNKTLRELMGVLHFPPILTSILLGWIPAIIGIWTLCGLFLSVGSMFGMMSGFRLDPEIFGELLVALPRWAFWGLAALAPWAVYFVIICPLSLIALCIDNPWNLVTVSSYVVLSAAYAPLAYYLKDVKLSPDREPLSWWVILAPFLVIAFVYVALTYQRDAQSINTAWASFLGLCRTLVYSTLAFVFLLPGCQHKDVTQKHYKVLVMFDVSGS